jgi:hypothetical protein
MLAALYGLAVAASPAVSFVDELDVAPKLKPRQMLAITTCPACTDYQDGVDHTEDVVCLKVEVEPQPDEKYNEEIKKGKIMCGRTSYGDEPCPDASKRACKKADPAPEDHPELRYYVKYLPKVEDAVVVPEGDEPAGADQESGMGNQITDNAAADMELDEINYHMMDGPWKGPNDISASPEPRPSEQALSERHDDVSSMQPKLCHCDKWLAGGSDELKYRCVKVEGTVKNPVNVCTENYGGKVNQCPSDSQAQACTGVPPPSPPNPPPAPPTPPSPA